jgi:predicted transcriptional regulator of viral defense system
MYETTVLEKFAKMPVFSLADLNQIIQNRGYAKKFLKRMVEQKKIFKIKRGVYTLYDDPFLVSTFILRPSYITSISALAYHKLITQIPNEVFCCTSKRGRAIEFRQKINFIHTNWFFGFSLQPYDSFKIAIATAEKAIIDSIGVVPLTVVEEAIPEIDRLAMLGYLQKIKKGSVVKRIGLLLERNGIDIYSKVKSYINTKYIPFDPLLKKEGRKNCKWFVIENG